MPASHILIPIHDFSAGGTELIAFRLARAWVKAGRRVTILAGASDGPLRPRVPEGVSVHVLDPERPRSRFSRFQLGKQMAPMARALAPDAIFIPGNFHFGLARPLKKALPDAAIVAKASNPVWSNGAIPVPRFVARLAVGLVIRGIDRVIAMAPALRSEVARYVDPMRVVTIPDPFLEARTKIVERPRKPARPGKPLAILLVGRLEEQKDPMLAVHAMGELRRFEHDATLTILGGGPLEADLRAEIDRQGLSDRVELAGYVADTRPYYAGADILLMTSHFEGVPAAIGEALAAGMPFVATQCSSWVTALAVDHPTLGTVVKHRTAAELAEALLQRAARPHPRTQAIDDGIGAHRVNTASKAYLELFDSLC